MRKIIYEGDCLEIMPTLADKSVDMILCDLPYGTTACKWDTVIPFEPLWKQYKRLIKDNGAIVLTASQPFTSALISSNMTDFKYCWVWDKRITTGFAFAKSQPMRAHEDVCIFTNGGKPHKYNPQFTERTAEQLKRFCHIQPIRRDAGEHYLGMKVGGPTRENNRFKFPDTVIRITGVNGRSGEKLPHPTQKPVALFEYLIRTYTNEGDTVLDNCAGSGTTGIACLNTGRKFILIEKDAAYCKIIKDRIEKAYNERIFLL